MCFLALLNLLTVSEMFDFYAFCGYVQNQSETGATV